MHDTAPPGGATSSDEAAALDLTVQQAAEEAIKALYRLEDSLDSGQGISDYEAELLRRLDRRWDVDAGPKISRRLARRGRTSA